MPYRVAALVWLALSLAVLSFAVVALARMSRLPTLAVFAAFAMPLYYFNLQWGQLPPLVVGALVATALAFRRKTYPLAGLACLVTAIEPHIGLPVCLTVFVLEPRTRATIAAGALGLGVLSIATCGVSVNLDYLRTVLPLQAMAEAPAANQYSLTWLAWFLGAPEAVALRLGFAWYVLATLIGVSLARAVARRFADEAFVAFVPAATVVLGGSFVHVTQTSVAIPLALLLFRYVDRASPLLWLGVALQIPMWFEASWAGRAFTPTRVESLVAVAAFVWLAAAPLARGRRTAAALLAGVAYLVLSSAIIRSPQMPIRSTQSAAAYDRTLGSDRRYTTGAWGTHIRADPVSRTSSVRSGAEKVPVWLGLAALLALCVGATATGRARPRAREALDTPGAGSPSCR
jgi:hypothetical protein